MATQADRHEVPEDTPASHSHDAHANLRAERPHAGHVHWHRHLDDREAGQAEGHAPATGLAPREGAISSTLGLALETEERQLGGQ